MSKDVTPPTPRRSVPSGQRLIPRWYAAVAIAIPTLMLLVMLGLAAAEAGVLRWTAGAMAVAFGLLAVAAVTALARPRRERGLTPDASGTITIDSPPALAWSLVAAWAVFLVVACLWAYLLVTDFDAVESPGFAFVVVVAALASLPDVVRLCTGRLHRWRLTLAPDLLTYRGYRTVIELPWSKVHGARIQERGPAGVMIDRWGTGPDPVVPIAAFALPAEQIVAEISRAKRGS